MGIFQVKNRLNGKILIELSKNLEAALNRCRFQLDLGSYPNKALQEEYNQCGKNQFSFEALDRLSPKKDEPDYNYTEDLELLKTMWLEKLKPFKEKGYNKEEIIP